MSLANILLVAIGGALGSVARFLLSGMLQVQSNSVMPWGTFTVNVLGCFVMGLVTSLAATHGCISPAMKLLLTTGFCGGFTTFSTFSHEALVMMQGLSTFIALLYVSMSIIVGILAAALGLYLGK